MQRFNVVVPRADGAVEMFPMKEWLRQNPEHVPESLHATDTNSRRLARALRKRGWRVQETASEYRLILPGAAANDAQVEAVLGGDETSDAEEANAVSFDLEAQLRDFIVANLARIDIRGRRVNLYRDSGGREGVEYPSGVGPIDILGQDDTGRFVVFELKIERGPDRTLGQIARYMGWVRQNLANGLPVSGVIFARQIDERLRYAALVMPDVTLLEYDLDFKLKPAGELGARDVG